MEYDFSGYATKNDLRCSDGRTIRAGAFKDDDGMEVPLCWNHRGKDDPANIIGKARLEHRADGVYAYCQFNNTPHGLVVKQLVHDKNVKSLSIHATNLIQKGMDVMHGIIREVSVVLAGANPGAFIDNIVLQHGDDYVELEDEAIIFAGIEIDHADGETDEGGSMSQDADSEQTVEDVLDSMSDEQQKVVAWLLSQQKKALTVEHSDPEDEPDEDDAEEEETDDQSDESDKDGEEQEDSDEDDSQDDDQINHSQEETQVTNVFETKADAAQSTKTLTHSDMKAVFEDAKRLGSLKEAVDKYALSHGIEDIDILFPDAKAVTNTPDFVKRRTEWVATVMSETKHTPFSRIKSLSADLTLDEARAKGYIKGNMKREEFFKVSKRVTTPQTVYKKQKLDRDDILDITDFDVVAWLRAEMRVMLDEELARAILVGDGRSNADDDKINETNIRPIVSDSELYVTTVYVNLDDSNSSAEEIIDALTLHRAHYRGSGNPTFFTSETILAKMLLIKDDLRRRVYSTVSDLAAALRVSKIVAVEVMEDLDDVVGIMVNLQDYTVGSDKGGNVTMFDDFDIDYNQYKYLIETRLSGALTKPKSAIVVRKVAGSAVLVTPQKPAFEDNEVTVPTQTGVVYKNKVTGTTLNTGSPVELAEDDELTVIAVPSGSGYYFATNADDEWFFKGEA